MGLQRIFALVAFESSKAGPRNGRLSTIADLAAFIIDSKSKAIKPGLRLFRFADCLWADRTA